MNRRPQKNNRHRSPRTAPQGAHPSRPPQRVQQHRDARAGDGVPAEELIMGRNCLQEVLRHAPSRLKEVFVAATREEGTHGQSARKQNLLDEVERAGIPVRERRREELDSLVQSDSHQGVVARVTPRRFLTLDELVERAAKADQIGILALDGVIDPHNVGAVLRAAECFGVSAVVWSKNRAAPLGPVVSKVSVGGSELVQLCPVGNLHGALEKLKSVGVWAIGAMVSPDAQSLESFDCPQKWLLVMGSEGEGIQRLIEENLDFRVYISMLGKLSSLNVSQATAVILHSLVSRSLEHLGPWTKTTP